MLKGPKKALQKKDMATEVQKYTAEKRINKLEKAFEEITQDKYRKIKRP